MEIVSKFHVHIFYNFQEISRRRTLRSGRTRSSFYMIQLVLKWSENFISIFSAFLKMFYSCLNVVEATYTWLLIRTSFASLTRNNVYIDISGNIWFRRFAITYIRGSVLTHSVSKSCHFTCGEDTQRVLRIFVRHVLKTHCVGTENIRKTAFNYTLSTDITY